MRIGVIGADAISDTLALWWRQAGHEVALSSPAASVADAAEFGEAVLFAPGWAAAHDVLDRVGHALDGKPVLDATNPARTRGGPPARSGLEQLAEWCPEAHWVKAFNTLPAEVLDIRRGHDPLLTEFLCTDHADARTTAAQLVRDIGLAPLYAGGADRAWLTESGPLRMREVDINDATAVLGQVLG
ncbi:NADPH-dependent F420 reductase [Actinoplanes sp. NPDC049681]|uniref:NADPH-dependent F420 reductase n=1 Tax=Actinoplanes sp. NPDC049681 TaxID=3363905 RepID=UPI0037A2D8D5